MNSRFIEITEKCKLPLSEYQALSPGDREFLLKFASSNSLPRKFLFHGDQVYIRADTIEEIVSVEGVKYEILRTEQIALLILEIDGNRYACHLHQLTTAHEIRRYIYENDLAFYLPNVGAKILGARIETRKTYRQQDSDNIPERYPYFMQEICLEPNDVAGSNRSS